jgi:hypothetical protein
MAYNSRRRSAPRPARWMDLHFAGKCCVCGGTIPKGGRGFYDPADRSVTCTKIDCAQRVGLTKQVWHGAPTSGQWVTVLSEHKIGQAPPMVDGHPVEYHPSRRDVFRYLDGSDSRWFARTRYGIRCGAENTGMRCEDAPCCGCCD